MGGQKNELDREEDAKIERKNKVEYSNQIIDYNDMEQKYAASHHGFIGKSWKYSQLLTKRNVYLNNTSLQYYLNVYLRNYQLMLLVLVGLRGETTKKIREY